MLNTNKLNKTFKQLKNKLLIGSLALAAISMVSACNEETNNVPPIDPNASTLAPGVTAPEGPFPRGTADPNFALDPATTGPEINVVSPSRGAQLTATSTAVQVQVIDINGVASVEIGGVTATSQGNSLYTATLNLDTNAVNFIPVTAVDSLGNSATATFSVVQGTFINENEFMTMAIGASLSNPGLNKAEAIVEDLTANLTLFPLIQGFNPVYDSFLAEINIADLANDPFRFSIRGEPGGLAITVHLDNVSVLCDIDGIGSILTQSATLLADRATAEVHATVSSTPANQQNSIKTALGLEIQSIDVAFSGFDVTFPSNLLTTIVSILRGTVRRFVEGALEDILVDVVDDFLGDAIPGFGQPLTVDLPIPLVGNSQINIDLCAHDADGSPSTGLGLVLGLRATPTVPQLSNVTDQIFSSGVNALPNVQMGDEFAVGLSSDAANGFLHALWKAGGIRVRLDGTNPQPGTTIALSVKLLLPFFPQLTGLAPDPDTPIVIEITSESAPTARIGQNNASVSLTANEVQFKVLIDYMDGQPPLEVMTLRTGLQAAADVALDSNLQLQISNLRAPVVSGDLISEPVVDLNDAELVNFLSAIVPLALDKLQLQIPPIPIPALPLGLQLDNPSLEIQQDFVIVRGSLLR